MAPSLVPCFSWQKGWLNLSNWDLLYEDLPRCQSHLALAEQLHLLMLAFLLHWLVFALFVALTYACFICCFGLRLRCECSRLEKVKIKDRSGHVISAAFIYLFIYLFLFDFLKKFFFLFFLN